jgi:hypothetical protein
MNSMAINKRTPLESLGLGYIEVIVYSPLHAVCRQNERSVGRANMAPRDNRSVIDDFVMRKLVGDQS